MKITNIEIEHYKSIREPVEVHFYDGLPTVLIGKNGSGKTNILEALHAIAEANGNYFGRGKALPEEYKVHLQLSQDDAARLFPGKKIDEDKSRLTACSGENGKVDRIESEYLIPLFRDELCQTHRLASKLKTALDRYEKQLDEIASPEEGTAAVHGFRMTDSCNRVTNYSKLKFQTENIVEQAEAAANSLLEHFSCDGKSFCSFSPEAYYLLEASFHHVEELSFRLEYEQPALAPFEAGFITVDEAAIRQEIKKINAATRTLCETITELLKELVGCIGRLREALTPDRPMSDADGAGYRLIHEIQRCIGGHCLFLHNESTDLLFRNDERGRQYNVSDKSLTVLRAYFNKVYDREDREELLQHMQSSDFSLPDEALTEFEQYLNAHIPEFDADMYDRISVERSDGKLPSILLHEKSGEIVDLNSTSAGRRWYFTYYFMKNTLAPGDVFMIDEPAAMLHPVAQKEIRKELQELEEQGIRVVYSTHSPYLIPDKWKCVQFVLMGDYGTETVSVSENSENCVGLMQSVVGNDIFNLQSIVEQFRLSDPKTVAHNCRNAIKRCYGSYEEAAQALGLSSETIKSWGKKSEREKPKCPRLENILLIAGKTGTDISKLLV